MRRVPHFIISSSSSSLQTKWSRNCTAKQQYSTHVVAYMLSPYTCQLDASLSVSLACRCTAMCDMRQSRIIKVYRYYTLTRAVPHSCWVTFTYSLQQVLSEFTPDSYSLIKTVRITVNEDIKHCRHSHYDEVYSPWQAVQHIHTYNAKKKVSKKTYAKTVNITTNKKAMLPQGNRAMPQVFFSVEVRQQHCLQV